MKALRYGLRAAARRRRWVALPAVTTATGAGLLVVVLSLLPDIRLQSAAFGSASDLARITVIVSLVVVLVGAIEVAIGATRAVGQRRTEIGILSASGTRPANVVAMILVEPVLGAVAGAAVGAVLAVVGIVAGGASGALHTPARPATVAQSVVLTVLLAAGASLLASVIPVVRAVRRPPVDSLQRRL
jgi:ABC-type antimicrobial peptide transport system permease subunit